jgi:hypothetical protein
MKRREGNQLLKFVQYFCIEYRWTIEARPAMDHSMAHTQEARAIVFGAQPGSECVECFMRITNRNVLLCKTLTIGAFGGQTRRRADAFDLTTRFEVPAFSRWSSKDTELKARRTGIEYECVVVHQ